MSQFNFPFQIQPVNCGGIHVTSSHVELPWIGGTRYPGLEVLIGLRQERSSTIVSDTTTTAIAIRIPEREIHDPNALQLKSNTPHCRSSTETLPATPRSQVPFAPIQEQSRQFAILKTYHSHHIPKQQPSRNPGSWMSTVLAKNLSHPESPSSVQTYSASDKQSPQGTSASRSKSSRSSAKSRRSRKTKRTTTKAVIKPTKTHRHSSKVLYPASFEVAADKLNQYYPIAFSTDTRDEIVPRDKLGRFLPRLC